MKGFLLGLVTGFVLVAQPITVGADVQVSRLALRLVAPASGAILSGSVPFVAVANSTGLASLQFYVDEKTLGAPIVSGPCRAVWDSTRVADGAHVLEARGLDAASAAVLSAPVTVTVKNAVAVLPAQPAGPVPQIAAAQVPPPLWAFLKPAVGATVRGDFTVTPQRGGSGAFRVELLKPDGTVALVLVRRTADPFALTGAGALPSGRYTLVLKTSLNQNPPAASVVITLDNTRK